MDYYELEIKQEDEIKAIRNEEEFLEIQPYGHYIVVNDLDFTAQNHYFNGAEWNGILDFNGHTFYKSAKTTESAVISIIGESGIVENIVLDIKLDNEVERSSFYRTILSKFWNSTKHTNKFNRKYIIAKY